MVMCLRVFRRGKERREREKVERGVRKGGLRVEEDRKKRREQDKREEWKRKHFVWICENRVETMVLFIHSIIDC